MYALSHSETDHILVISWYLVGQTIKMVLRGSPRCPDSYDLSERHDLYDLARHVDRRNRRVGEILHSAKPGPKWNNDDITSLFTSLTVYRRRLSLNDKPVSASTYISNDIQIHTNSIFLHIF